MASWNPRPECYSRKPSRRLGYLTRIKIRLPHPSGPAEVHSRRTCALWCAPRSTSNDAMYSRKPMASVAMALATRRCHLRHTSSQVLVVGWQSSLVGVDERRTWPRRPCSVDIGAYMGRLIVPRTGHLLVVHLLLCRLVVIDQTHT